MGVPGEGDSRQIGMIQCLAFAVGTMVGGGVFTLSGTAINDAGPAALLSYAIAGAIMLLSALSFTAVAVRAAPGDSGYGPIADLLGKPWRFVVMWSFYVNGAMLLVFLLISFGDYLNQYFFDLLAPTAAALVAVGVIATLNLGPTAVVAKAETAVVALKIVLLMMLVAWGLAKFKGDVFTPFSPHGSHGISVASALLFTAYTGFNVVTNMADKLKNPQRAIPIGVIGSILISGVVYVGVIVAMLVSGVKNFGPDGVGQAATALMGSWGGYVLAFAACLSTLSGANANMLGASEVMLRLVAQGDVPEAVGRTSKGGHPTVSVALITVGTVILVLVANVNDIIAYSNVAALIAMIVVNIAAIRLSARGWPGTGLRLPGGPLLPIIGVVTCASQFPSIGWGRVAIGALIVMSGFLLYARRADERFAGDARRLAQRSLDELTTPLGKALSRLVPRG